MIRTFKFRRITPFGCTAEEIHASWTNRVWHRRHALLARAGKPSLELFNGARWQRHNRKIYFSAPRKLQQLPA